MKKYFILAMLIPLLAACTVTVGIVTNPWSSAKSGNVQTGNGAPTALESENVAPGDAFFYTVKVPAGADDLIIVEATSVDQANLTITVHGSTSESDVDFTSTSPAFFSGSSAGAAQAIGTEGIGVATKCLGPCIAILNDGSQASDIYVKVAAASSTTVDFFAYAVPFGDLDEPGNNTCDNIDAASIVITPDPEGFFAAIETLGDHDCYSSSGNVSTFNLRVPADNTSVPIRADVYSAASGQLIGSVTVNSGENKDIIIPQPQVIDIDISSSNGRAAPASNSRYVLTF